jgi:hypothetical protein
MTSTPNTQMVSWANWNPAVYRLAVVPPRRQCGLRGFGCSSDIALRNLWARARYAVQTGSTAPTAAASPVSGRPWRSVSAPVTRAEFSAFEMADFTIATMPRPASRTRRSTADTQRDCVFIVAVWVEFDHA